MYDFWIWGFKTKLAAEGLGVDSLNLVFKVLHKIAALT